MDLHDQYTVTCEEYYPEDLYGMVRAEDQEDLKEGPQPQNLTLATKGARSVHYKTGERPSKEGLFSFFLEDLFLTFGRWI